MSSSGLSRPLDARSRNSTSLIHGQTEVGGEPDTICLPAASAQLRGTGRLLRRKSPASVSGVRSLLASGRTLSEGTAGTLAEAAGASAEVLGAWGGTPWPDGRGVCRAGDMLVALFMGVVGKG